MRKPSVPKSDFLKYFTVALLAVTTLLIFDVLPLWCWWAVCGTPTL